MVLIADGGSGKKRGSKKKEVPIGAGRLWVEKRIACLGKDPVF